MFPTDTRERPQGPRILLYTHNTRGLGHAARMVSLSWALYNALPGASVLCCTGGMHDLAKLLPPIADYVKLPSYRARERNGIIELFPERLQIPRRHMISLRRNLLTAAARSFRPHILIADYIPLGKDRELEGAVRLVRSLPRRLLCLGLRDIINDQQRADEYLRQSVFKPVRDYFDTVFVYSDQDWVNFHAEYDIPDDLIKRFVHVGYVVNTAPVDGTSALLDQLFQSIGPGERLVIAGAGGGKDALGMLLMIIKAWCSLDFGVLPPCRLVIVAGPYSLSPEREALRSALSGCTNAQVVDEVPSLYKILQRAELYIGACGYNTTTEVLNAETRAIFIPREQVDSTEQLIRAQRLQAAGQWDVLQEGPSAPFELRDRLVAVLGGPQHTRGCAPTIRLDGASQTANRIYDWWLNRRSLTFER